MFSGGSPQTPGLASLDLPVRNPATSTDYGFLYSFSATSSKAHTNVLPSTTALIYALMAGCTTTTSADLRVSASRRAQVTADGKELRRNKPRLFSRGVSRQRYLGIDSGQ